MMRTGTISSKVKQHRGIMAIIAKVPSLANKTRDFLTVGTSRTCSDEGSRKDKCSNAKP